MACGTPVVTSNRYAMPEVGGDAVILCDPTDPDCMAACIFKLLDDEKNDEYRKLGLDRIKRFSWSEITNEYINLYNELSD
jgi:glycosyltransferase involved in cell wall biosynthesis